MVIAHLAGHRGYGRKMGNNNHSELIKRSPGHKRARAAANQPRKSPLMRGAYMRPQVLGLRKVIISEIGPTTRDFPWFYGIFFFEWP
jgi:hypothetical protein